MSKPQVIKTLMALFFTAGVFFIVWSRDRSKHVSITINNRSDEAVAFVLVKGHNLYPQMSMSPPLKPGSTFTIRLQASGYSSYTLEAVFESGRSMKPEERLALGGFGITENIQSAHWNPEWDSLSFLYEEPFRWAYGGWLKFLYAD